MYDYGFRIYNPRIGKFLSVDPLTADYPWYTPYQFAGNKPIWAIDLDGLEEWFVTKTYSKNYIAIRLVYNAGHVGEGVQYTYIIHGVKTSTLKQNFNSNSLEEKMSTAPIP